MSQFSSVSSSRAVSPCYRSRTPTPLIKSPQKPKSTFLISCKQFINSQNFLFMYLTVLLPFVWLLFIRNPPYCIGGLNSYCIKCPKNGNCLSVFKLRCNSGYQKIDNFCIAEEEKDKIQDFRQIKKEVQSKSFADNTNITIDFPNNNLKPEDVMDYLVSNFIIEEKDNKYSKIIVKYTFTIATSISITIYFFITSIRFLVNSF